MNLQPNRHLTPTPLTLALTWGQGGSLADWLAVAGLRRSRAWVQIAAATLSGNSLRQTVHTHRASVHQAAKLNGCGGNCGPGGKYWQNTAGFMTHVTCRLTAKNRDQLRNPTLGNRVRATFTFFNLEGGGLGGRCAEGRCPDT